MKVEQEKEKIANLILFQTVTNSDRKFRFERQ